MKKFEWRAIAACVLLTGMAACNDNDKNPETEGPVEVVLKTTLPTVTRATDTEWDRGDIIGLAMYTPDTLSVVNGQFNYQYTSWTGGATGDFNAISGEDMLYFPQNGNSIRLKGYYPYYPGLTADWDIPVDVTDQSVLTDIDLMTGIHVRGFSKDDPEAWMIFYHRLVKLVFVMSQAPEETPINFSTVEMQIQNVYRTNVYNGFANEFLDQAGSLGTLDVPYRTGETASQRQAIVLPRAAGSGVVFRFETPTGDNYIAELPEDLELISGNRYTFYIILSPNPVLDIEVTIEDWNDIDPQYIIAQ